MFSPFISNEVIFYCEQHKCDFCFQDHLIFSNVYDFVCVCSHTECQKFRTILMKNNNILFNKKK